MTTDAGRAMRAGALRMFLRPIATYAVDKLERELRAVMRNHFEYTGGDALDPEERAAIRDAIEIQLGAMIPPKAGKPVKGRRQP